MPSCVDACHELYLYGISFRGSMKSNKYNYNYGDLVNKENNIYFLCELPRAAGKRKALFLFACGSIGDARIDHIRDGITKGFPGLRQQLLPGFIRCKTGELASVDLADWDRLREHNWFYHKGYMLNTSRTLMHRLLLGDSLSDQQEVDHINGDGLDNRRSNLRIASSSQNSHNTAMRADNNSGEKGVSWDKRKQKWHACISYKNKKYRMGCHSCFLLATILVNRKRAELHKEFANYGEFNQTL